MNSHPIAKHDVDQSSNEKGTIDTQLEKGDNPYVGGLPPDPDAHLSVEERAAIVSLSNPDIKFAC